MNVSLNRGRSTQKSRVMDYLCADPNRTLTAAQAEARFGVKNLRALVAKIRTTVEAFGNWEVYSETNRSGNTAYGIEFVGSDENVHAQRVGIA